MIRYSYSKDSQPIADVEASCHYSTKYWIYWRNYGNLPEFIRKFEEAVYGRNSSDYEHCIKNTKQNVAIVHFHIAPSANDLINKIVKSPRVTYADILSNIGILATPHYNLQINNP